jgi:long-subunit fatty acid transport protein
MKSAFSVVAIVAVFVVSNFGYAQQYNIVGAGARAEGLGGAFIGVADDATAVVWNPAGLSQLQRAEASTVARSVGEKWEYVDKRTPANNDSYNQSHIVFNFGSLAVPLKVGGLNFVLAAAYQRQIDFYDVLDTPDDKYTETGGIDTFTPGIGIQITSWASFGAAANIWFGKDDFTEDYPTSASPTGMRNLKENGTYSGFNIVVGALFDLGGTKQSFPLKLGVSAKAPFKLSNNYTNQYTPPRSGYSFGSLSTWGTHGTVEMPWMIGLGASYRMGENLTVAVDYEMRAFGNKQKEIVFDPPYDQYSWSSSKTDMSVTGKDLNQFRVGAEYLIVLDFGVFPLRAGYQNVPTLMGYKDQAGKPTDQVIGAAFSVGTGYISERFALDVTFSQSSHTSGGYTSLGGQWTNDYTKTSITGSLIFYF